MPHNHEAVAALPIGNSPGNSADKTALRNLIEKRLAYVVDDAANAADLVAVDPATGTVILVIICLGRNFLYDPLDTTTAHDGTSCLVTSDGKRYKLAAGSDMVAYSALDRTGTPPTNSPDVLMGDVYLTTTGSTGAWSGHDNQIAVYTARGWEFVVIEIGRLIYVEDEDAYYRKKADGTISIGFGSNAIASGGILPSQLLGGGQHVLWNVVNQTTNAPPAVTNGTQYIIGSAPSGAWAGHANKIAHGEAGSWVIYTPAEGWLAWDQNLNGLYQYNGSVWQSASGRMQMTRQKFTSSGTFNKSSRCVFVDVTVVGGTGGADANSGAGNGGLSSFGAHCSATGSTAGNAGVGTPGTGSSGDVNVTGRVAYRNNFLFYDGATQRNGFFGEPGFVATEHGHVSGVQHFVHSSLTADMGFGASGGPGMSSKRILDGSLGSSESYTVGAAGTAGSTGPAGVAGFVVVEEWVLT